MHERRAVLRGIGAGTAVLLGGVGLGGARGGDAKVRVAHAVPDAPSVEVTLTNTDDESVSETVEVAFEDVTGYLEVPAGEYEVAVPAAGFTATVELEAEDYTAAAIGNLAPEGDEDGFTVDLFQDKLGRLTDGQGRVRVYHGSPDAPAVDVRVVDDDLNTVLTLADGLEFGNAGPNVEVDAGTYSVAVFPAGGSNPVLGPVDVEVRDGEVLTVFAEGELNPEGDEDGFKPVLAYEDAAPPDDAGGGGDRGNEEESEDDEEDEDRED